MADSEYIALGDIEHWTAPDKANPEGKRISLRNGDAVPREVGQDEIDRLHALGAVAHRDEFGRNPVDEAAAEALAEREAELAEREAELAEREKALEGEGG